VVYEVAPSLYAFALALPNPAYAAFKLSVEFNAWNGFVEEFAGG
jgi:hypothetical protein